MTSKEELIAEIEHLYDVISDIERRHIKQVEVLRNKIKEMLSEVRR